MLGWHAHTALLGWHAHTAACSNHHRRNFYNQHRSVTQRAGEPLGSTQCHSAPVFPKDWVVRLGSDKGCLRFSTTQTVMNVVWCQPTCSLASLLSSHALTHLVVRWDCLKLVLASAVEHWCDDMGSSLLLFLSPCVERNSELLH